MFLQTDKKRNNTLEKNRQIARSIVARIEKGDLTAEQEMCLRYESVLRRVLWPLVNNYSDVDDLINNIWLVAIPKLRRGELRAPETLVAYLSTMARRLAANENRKRNRQKTDADTDLIDKTVSSEGDPLKQADTSQAIELTAELIDLMPTNRDRDILTRRFFKHQERTKICDELDLTTVQLSKILSRAKYRLRKLAIQNDFASIFSC